MELNNSLANLAGNMRIRSKKHQGVAKLLIERGIIVEKPEGQGAWRFSENAVGDLNISWIPKIAMVTKP